MSKAISRRLAVCALVMALPLAGVACSSDDDSSSTTTAAGAGADSSTTAADSDDPGTTEAASTEPEADAEGSCEADSDNLSGSSTVLFSADVDTGQTEADITPDLTMTISDGAAEPDTLTVPVNTMFGVALPADAGVTGIVVGCAGSQTAMPGGTIGFMITSPGTYAVSDELAGVEVGTIVVE